MNGTAAAKATTKTASAAQASALDVISWAGLMT